MRGNAREMLVRSIKAMVYITSATGMMRVQRPEPSPSGGESLAWLPALETVAVFIDKARDGPHGQRDENERADGITIRMGVWTSGRSNHRQFQGTLGRCWG